MNGSNSRDIASRCARQQINQVLRTRYFLLDPRRGRLSGIDAEHNGIKVSAMKDGWTVSLLCASMKKCSSRTVEEDTGGRCFREEHDVCGFIATQAENNYCICASEPR